jgi:hypothetical protein
MRAEGGVGEVGANVIKDNAENVKGRAAASTKKVWGDAKKAAKGGVF